MAPKTEAEARLARRRKKWLIRAGVAISGIGLGYLCPSFPESLQAFCHLFAKALSLLGGSP
jgi:hypothetical protein